MDNVDEKILLERIAQGEEAAFAAIFDLYKDRFYAAALKMTRSPDLSEEIVQEVFVTLWLRRSVLSEVEHPQAYLLSIVYNHISTHFRKLAIERRAKLTIQEHLRDAECITEQIIAEKENQQILDRIVNKLPTQQQLIYHLSKQDGLSRDEIADRLQISPHTVKNHLLKAMKYIRAHFKEAFTIFFL